MNEIFKELKVIELASVLAGPAVGLFFAELGAKVIKLENKLTDGDVTRSWKLTDEQDDSNSSAYYQSINWNKQSIFLDLKDTTDYNLAINYIKDADIVISNFKQGSAKSLKLDFETLKRLNNKLIYAEISSYGENDPRPGFDVVMQAETGWISMTGSSEKEIAKLPVALIDLLTAHQIKEGILLALLRREKLGKAQKVSASLYDSSIASLANQASNFLNVNHVPKRRGTTHPNIAPYGDIVFTKDEKAIILSVGTQEQFVGLCRSLNASQLSENDLYIDNKTRLQHRYQLMKELALRFKGYDYNDIAIILKKNKVPFSPIKDLREVFEDPKAQKLVYSSFEDGKEVKRVKSVVFKLS